MRTQFLFLLLFIFALKVSGQKKQRQIDSLQLLLQQQLPDDERIKLYKNLFTKVYVKEPELGKVYLDSFVAIAHRLGPERHWGAIHSYYASYYESKSDYVSAKESFKKAIKSYETVGNHRKKARAIARLGSMHSNMGDYETAMKAMLASARVLESLNYDDNSLGRTYARIGGLQRSIKNYELSTEYFLKAEAQFIDANHEKDVANVRGDIGTNLKYQKRFAEGIAYLEQSIAYFKKEKLLINLARKYNQMGTLYLACDSIDKAKSYFTLALKLSTDVNKEMIIADAKGNLGNAHFKNNEFNKALQRYLESFDTHKKTKNVISLREDYFNLARTYKAVGNYKKAYEFKEKHFNLHDSIFKKESIENLQNLEVRYETEKKETALELQDKEIETLNKEVKISNLTKTLYSIGMIGFIAISGLLYFGYNQRIKRFQIAREKKEAMLHQEIEFKKKELTSQTLHLVQKNTFIEELKENLVRIKDSPELFKIEFRRLIMLLKKENAEDKDWEVFKSYFSEVHNNFDLKLKDIQSSISEKEIRLASFLRMNLSTKEIASMLNVLPDSVLKSKYRLKKKLNISKDDDLTSFLNNL